MAKHACPLCGQAVVVSVGGWRDCRSCGWHEARPTLLREIPPDGALWLMTEDGECIRSATPDEVTAIRASADGEIKVRHRGDEVLVCLAIRWTDENDNDVAVAE
jgi:hypothetical protein